MPHNNLQNELDKFDPTGNITFEVERDIGVTHVRSFIRYNGAPIPVYDDVFSDEVLFAVNDDEEIASWVWQRTIASLAARVARMPL